MSLSRAFHAAIFVLGLGALACGSKTEQHAGIRGAGVGGAGGSAPTAAADSGGDKASEPAVQPPRPATVPCGATSCTQHDAPGFTTPDVCCFDADMGVCSTKAPTGGCAPPLELDPRCPAVQLWAMTFQGCCTADGNCGADSSIIGMGCKDLADTAFRALNGELPEPRRCDAAPDADAGP
jgi:hypothetical protein